MFDWNELLIIGAAALIFIGPKELPGTLRTIGKFVAKARTMAREFQTNVDDMVREAELDEVKKQVQKLEYGGLERMVQETVDPKGSISKALEAPNIDAAFGGGSSAPGTAPAVAAPTAPAVAAPSAPAAAAPSAPAAAVASKPPAPAA